MHGLHIFRDLSAMGLADILGYVAALLVFITFSMKTMVPLRLVGIASNVFFIGYGYLNPAYPVLILHTALLVLNLVRLREMLALVRNVEEALHGDLDMNWVKPFTTTRAMRPGEVLFRKGDEATEVIFIMSGSLRIPELGISVPPGEVVGELGMLAPDSKRTASAVCVDGGDILVITYDQVRELFFQNPRFGYFFMRLSSRRLFENMKRMQSEIETLRGTSGEDFAPLAPYYFATPRSDRRYPTRQLPHLSDARQNTVTILPQRRGTARWRAAPFASGTRCHVRASCDRLFQRRSWRCHARHENHDPAAPHRDRP